MSTISATDTEVQKPVNVFYNQMLLENARPFAPYFLGTQAGSLSEQAGTATMAWRRYNTSADNASGIAPTTTALAELTTTAAYMQGRTSSTVHFSAVTATAAKYGQYYILNEEVDMLLPNGTSAGIVATLAISAGRSLNQLQRNVVDDNATLVYANGASDGAVNTVIAAADFNSVINTLSRNSAMPFTPMSAGSDRVGSAPILPGFWGFCHPDVAYDISQITGFTSVEKYAGHVDTQQGEFGAYGLAGYTVRLIQTPDATVDAGSGATTSGTSVRGTSGNSDLYTTAIYGQNAVGSMGLGTSYADGVYRPGQNNPSPIQLIFKGRGQVGGDPYDEISTMAWKSWHAGAILNANWVRAVRSAATSL